MTARSRARRLVLAAAVVATAGALAAPASASGGETSPYIVVLHDSVRSAGAVADEHRRSSGAQVSYTYEHALKGYAARLTRQGYAEVASDRRVKYVEADGIVTASATQSGATWGLDRADQRNLPLSGTFTYTNTGTGVKAYVIDTGIRRDHDEFGGRVQAAGFDAFTDSQNGEDCNGHGTHVAGTVGGTTNGVAKEVTLVPVRVLDCGGSGSYSGVIAGVNWVASQKNEAPGQPAVANMSLGGGASTAVDDAVKNLITSGVQVAIAAGNSGQDACRTSPARVTSALTVGATDRADKKASWSNFGKCLDLFAPGVGITSAWHDGASSTNTISGTSMAAPHVAGVAALFLTTNPGASSADVAAAINGSATMNKVGSAGRGSPNRLLFTAY